MRQGRASATQQNVYSPCGLAGQTTAAKDLPLPPNFRARGGGGIFLLTPGPTSIRKVHPGFRRKNAAAARVRAPRPNNSQRAFYFRETIYRKFRPNSSTGNPCFLPTLPVFISKPCFLISSRISFSPKSFVPSAFRKKGLHSSTSLSCASPMSGMPAYFSAIADTEASMKTLLAGSV